ncbi:serine/threonine-protein kinase [Nocardia sp. NPDC003482]
MSEDLGPGGYRIERVLGSGGMGTVYLARHPRLPRSVALKVLGRAADAEFRARFTREAELAARVDHPNVVEVYDRGSDGDRPWIAMRYVAGTDVRALIRQGPHGLPAARALGILEQAAAGLDAAHRRGLIHRDVKPANLLVGDDDGTDHVFVTDFGIARAGDDPVRLTATGALVATLAYVAPEQILGAPVDHRADIYSLGCTLFEMLTGTVPFGRPAPAAIVAAHLNDPPPRPSESDPALPPAIDEVIARALAKDPRQRYPTCAALAAAARQALAPRPTSSLSQQHPGAHASPSSPREVSHSTPSPPQDIPHPPAGSASQPHGIPYPAAGSSSSSHGISHTATGSGSSSWGGSRPIADPIGSSGGVVSYSVGGPPRDDVYSPVGSTAPSGRRATVSGRGSGIRRTVLLALGLATVVGTALAATIFATRDDPGPHPLPTTTMAAPATASPPSTTSTRPGVTAWGRDNDLVALFPGLLPPTPGQPGYQGAHCEDLNVLNNGGAPAVSCTQDNGIEWTVWSFRRGDPRRDSMFATNIANDTTREQVWSRPSGTGRVRTSYYPGGNTGLLTVAFDDPARAWVVIDVGWDHHTGQDLAEQWFANAPI